MLRHLAAPALALAVVATLPVAGTARTTAPGFDVDALVGYLGAGTPVAPGPANRITKLG
ncbi:hypothetical protein [Micromonospora zhanjiangensis]|uniref:Uncharacterized protein n=1 Tax=Micromonospora zhanjiangensis TaxID=1522057 RepID=A0ABV8KS54_9ACTN